MYLFFRKVKSITRIHFSFFNSVNAYKEKIKIMFLAPLTYLNPIFKKSIECLVFKKRSSSLAIFQHFLQPLKNSPKQTSVHNNYQHIFQKSQQLLKSIMYLHPDFMLTSQTMSPGLLLGKANFVPRVSSLF